MYKSVKYKKYAQKSQEILGVSEFGPANELLQNCVEKNLLEVKIQNTKKKYSGSDIWISQWVVEEMGGEGGAGIGLVWFGKKETSDQPKEVITLSSLCTAG